MGRALQLGSWVVMAWMAPRPGALAAWTNHPPSLSPPAGRILKVSTEPQLQSALGSLRSGDTILISPGTYSLTRTVIINGPLSDVTIRGATDFRDDVVLAGPGRDNANYGSVPHGIWVGGNVQRLTVANLSIREVFYHPIIFNPGPQEPHIYNVHLINGGEQLIKTNPNPDGTGIDNGIVEHSLFEYTPTSRNWYANAIQVLAGKNWIIRNNLIRNVRAPRGELAGPAVLAWFSASGTIVEANTFVNCQREISFGLIERKGNDHTGGVIRNNFIYRDATVAGDVAIGVFDSPGTKVLHNTILVAGRYPNAVEYRFAHTTGVIVANNLMNRAVAAREGAVATVRNNYLSATPDFFLDPAKGDLHLKPTATLAIRQADPLSDAKQDWDGANRPSAGRWDLGADEH